MQQLQFIQTVLLVLLILVSVSMVVIILLQRSEGGALGMGGGGGGGLMTARGAGNLLTRTTAVLATLFFMLSVGLTILGNYENSYTAVGRASHNLKLTPAQAAAEAKAAAAQNPGQPVQPNPALGGAANNSAAGSLGALETGGPIQLKPSGGQAPGGAPASQPPAKK
ncbi:MAG TPA: preprotein translocase subunit SecG [Caulobacteraceae bacterium]|jgi:preprotein translocase subunit SecG|nr:preprotein translocase subunit SecG [Caulobacteraceae bacterium]